MMPLPSSRIQPSFDLCSLGENNTRRSDENLCVHHLFEAQVERFPEAPAVVFENQTLTYDELNRRANQLAHELLQFHVGPETLIGVCLERSLEMIIGMLGILKAGAAYVPLEPAFPEKRLSAILEDAHISLVLTQDSLYKKFSDNQARILCLDSKRKDIDVKRSYDNPSTAVIGKNIVYVLFTSGSTGQPKGVMVEHRHLWHYLSGIISQLALPSGLTFALVSTFAADLGNTVLFPALCTGGCLHLLSEKRASNPEAFAEYFSCHAIDCLKIVPSHLSLLLMASHPERVLPSRFLILGGESFSWELLEKIRALNPSCAIINHYGPTETTVGVVTYNVEKKLSGAHQKNEEGNLYARSIPIGRPLEETQIYLLDDNLQPVPVGSSGEIYIGGNGVTRGYLHQPGLTAERFLPDPFQASAGRRLYKTGDRARYLTDGNIEFLGRIDFQVKIHGFRIETQEIEHALEQHPAFDKVVVLACEDDSGDKRLIAYLLPRNENIPTTQELRGFLKNSLPSYMIPSAFIMLKTFPLTPNGKLDRQALPLPDNNFRLRKEETFAPPVSRLQHILVSLWQDVLHIEHIGIHDNFFELGGDSIKGAIFMNSMQERLQEIVHVVALFDAPTVIELENYFNTHYPEAVKRLVAPEAKQHAKQHKTSKILGFVELEKFRQQIPPVSPPNPVDKQNPPIIFVLSPPRSGSTLLRVILGGHSRLFAPPELALLSFNTLSERKTQLYDRQSFRLEGAIRALMQIKTCDAEEARRLMQYYEDQQYATQQFYLQLQQWLGERILVDKSTTYALNLETLKNAETYFRDALYIHLLRHPCGMIRSFEKARLDQIFFRREHSFSRHELAELIWTVSHQNILDFLKTIPQNRQYQVKFEDLVKSPQKVIEEMCQFLRISFEPQMLQPYQDPKKQMTDGLYSVSRMIGDPTFHEHQHIEAYVANAWRNMYREEMLGEPTRGIAKILGYLQEKDSLEEARQLLGQLDQLSDDEVSALLNGMLSEQ